MSYKPKNEQEAVDIIKANKVVFIKFGAQWCGPCHAIQPYYDELAQKYEGRGIFLTVEVDDEEFETLVRAYKVSSIPAFHVFSDTKLVDMLVGANKDALGKLVAKYVTE